MKKIFCYVISICVLLSNSAFLGIHATAIMDDESFSDSFIETPQEIFMQHLAPSTVDATELELPATVDNSTSIYFPTIGNQGNYGSCVAWASVYYLYTYETNRLHNTAATTIEETGIKTNINTRVYSPAWVYSVLSESSQKGIPTHAALSFSVAHGQVTLNDFPYYSTANPYPSVPTNTEIITNALSTRAHNWYSTCITTQTTPITSPDSELLDEVKNLLTNAYILEINCNAGFDTKTNSIGEQCVYRTFAADGHAMTVVGYNDEIWCDINGDGIAQDAEYGAFKVANSWGPSWGNSGFIWFSYDALNESSTVPGDWENSLSGIRKSGFSYSSDSLSYNWFTYMNV